jgi:cobalt-zinc-cadmium efflux system outer membrane protein
MSVITPHRLTERTWRWLGLGVGRRRWAACLSGVVCAALAGAPAPAGPQLLLPAHAQKSEPPAPPAARPEPIPAPVPVVAPPAVPVLSRDAAVRWALEYNPEIAAIRAQHGIAAAGVVIARTYPFNPTAETRVRYAQGPPDAGVFNPVPVETVFLMELEVRGQGRWRRRGAAATLSRTDSEIAFQELGLAVRVARAFDGLLYRREKLALAAETLRVTQDIAEKVDKLFKGGGGPAKLKAADVLLIRSEVHDLAAQVSMARATLVTTEADLRRALGVVEAFDVSDRLDAPVDGADPRALLAAALDRRPDRLAREAAVQEVEAKLKLEVANRFGNPLFGPAHEYNEANANFIGAQLTLPIPIFNRHTGDIRQREAERDRAVLELRQTEVQIAQDVAAAAARLEAARSWIETYRKTILPELKKTVDAIEKLFESGDTSVDILRVLDVRRKLLRARDGYLDALWELRQAEADLAAALGDPSLLAPGLCAAPCPPPHP